jgi:hypothetical protein
MYNLPIMPLSYHQDRDIKRLIDRTPREYKIPCKSDGPLEQIVDELKQRLGIDDTPYSIIWGEYRIRAFYDDDRFNPHKIDKNLALMVVSSLREIVIVPGSIEIDAKIVADIQKKIGIFMLIFSVSALVSMQQHHILLSKSIIILKYFRFIL